jgi:hypothetical protein
MPPLFYSMYYSHNKPITVKAGILGRTRKSNNPNRIN